MPSSALTEETARFFRAPIYPTVTTILPDGAPQSSVVWSKVEDGEIVFSTIRGRRKTRNMERDPRVTLIAHDPADPYSYVEVRGTATFEDDPTASLIDELSREYDGTPWVRREGEERIIVRVTPTKVVPHVAPQSRANAVAAQGGPVRQLRLVVHADDYEDAVHFYRDVLGMPQEEAYSGGNGAEVMILGAGRATLEIANTAQVEMIDAVEVGHRVAPKFRLALEVEDTDAAAAAASDGGATVVAPPTRTPWNSLNARLDTVGGIQLTLFQEGVETDLVDEGDWLDHYFALCLSMATEITPEQLAASLYPDAVPFATAQEAIDWMYDDASERRWLGIGVREGVTFAWEENGFRGSLREYIERVPARTFWSAFWNANAGPNFQAAADGRLVRDFNCVVRDEDPGFGTPFPEESDLPWEDDPTRSSLVLLSRLAGTEMPDLSWFWSGDDVQYYGCHAD